MHRFSGEARNGILGDRTEEGDEMSVHRKGFGAAEIRKIGRRSVIVGGVGALITAALSSFISRQFETLGERLGTSDARRLFQSMFGTGPEEKSTALFSGRRDYAAGLHPENAAASATLRRELRLLDQNEETRDTVDYNPTDNMVVVGGINSNIRTMIAWEASGPSMDRLSRPEERGEEPLIPLRWFGSSDRADESLLAAGPVGWRMEGQGVVSTIDWALRDTVADESLPSVRGRKSVLDRDGRKVNPLLSNYLYITRMPDFLHPGFAALSPSEWPYMTVFQGMHGAGTRAIELLVTGRGLAGLQAAHERLNGAAAYQILFQASGLGTVEAGSDFYNAFYDIDLVGVHNLQNNVDPSRYMAAHLYAMRRLNQRKPWNA
jgi:hypothetical protein